MRVVPNWGPSNADNNPGNQRPGFLHCCLLTPQASIGAVLVVLSPLVPATACEMESAAVCIGTGGEHAARPYWPYTAGRCPAPGGNPGFSGSEQSHSLQPPVRPAALQVPQAWKPSRMSLGRLATSCAGAGRWAAED